MLTAAAATSASAPKLQDPEYEARRIAAGLLLPGDRLPETESFELYYVRGVGNDVHYGGEDIDRVIYPPEFLYLLDVGFDALIGVVVGFTVSGLGDPAFPRFEDPLHVRSVPGREPGQLIFPNQVGEILVSPNEGVGEEALKSALAPHTQEVECIFPDCDGVALYRAAVRPFFETTLVETIESLSEVKYAQTNGIVRLIDFRPGWLVDRVA